MVNILSGYGTHKKIVGTVEWPHTISKIIRERERGKDTKTQKREREEGSCWEDLLVAVGAFLL